jgi:hypothetical protein
VAKIPKPPNHEGKPVHFGDRRGVIEDEVFAVHKKYAECAQRILWDDGDCGIRLTYLHWNSEKRRWNYSSRKAPTHRPAQIKKFLRKVLAQDWW